MMSWMDMVTRPSIFDDDANEVASRFGQEVEVCCVVLGRQLLGLYPTWRRRGAGARAARAPVAMLRASAVDLLLVSLLTTVGHAGPQNLNIHCRAHQPSRTNPRIIIKLT